MENIKSSISSLLKKISSLKNLLEKLLPSKKSKRFLVLLSLTTSSYLTYHLLLYTQDRIKARQLSLRSARLLSKRNSKPLPALSLPSPSHQSYIISLNAHEISSKIRAGELSFEEVLSTFVYRAYHIGRELRLSGEEPFDQAFASLETLSSQQDGILLGVPISVKDEIDQAGCSSATGITWAAEEIKENDSVLITLLRKQGAIPFVRGSAMQGLMWYETTNNIYGTAVNPWNKDRTT